MWWWRKVGSLRRWAEHVVAELDQVREAARDLQLRPGEAGLSVFAVEDAADGLQVAQYFAWTLLPKADQVTYLLIPEDTFRGIGRSPEPDPEVQLHPFLRERHYQVSGLTDELAEQMTRNILSSPERQVYRLTKRELRAALVEGVARDPRLREYLTAAWAMICEYPPQNQA
jgi:hypothetical protein